MMRDGATALASGQSETIIDVKLPGRSYPIVIGEGLVASAGRRIAAALIPPTSRHFSSLTASWAPIRLHRLRDLSTASCTGDSDEIP